MKQILAVLAATAFLAVATFVALQSMRDSPAQTAAAAHSETVVVVASRLLQTVQLAGATLGYSDARIVSGIEAGTLTALPATGSVIGRGDVLYRVDERPVTLFFGAVPAWRSLGPADSPGHDIRQLKLNLVAFGDDPARHIKLDDRWNRATTFALERWQSRRGEVPTGTVSLGEIVFLPGPRRVGVVTAVVGGPANGPLYTTTSLEPIATVLLDATQEALARRGSHVRVRLPSGRTGLGVVASVTFVAASPPTNSSSVAATVIVSVSGTFAQLGGYNYLDGAPATVMFQSASVRALAVPVTALLAVAGGGFALELAGTHRLVPVSTGMDAGGFVQVSGALHPGLRVLAAAG